MKIPKNFLNNAWKIILLPALIAIFGSVANYFGYTLEAQETTNNPSINITGDGNVPGNGNVFGNDNVIDNSRQTTNIKEQINTDRNIQTEQYNENDASGITNCSRNNDSCIENQIINNN